MPFTQSTSVPTSWWDKDVLSHLFLCAVFITCNFMLFWMPLLLVGAIYYESTICRALLLLQIIDLMIPIHPGPRGYWPAWNDFCDNTDGLVKYNDLELIVERDGQAFDHHRHKNYLLCYFPHSLYGAGLFVLRRYFYQNHNGMTMLFSGADIIFHVPLLRRIMTWWGLTRVSKQALKHTLHLPFPHNICMFQPDGIAGMFYGIEQEQIVLNKRRGFCKIALQTGASLVPCYVLGANDLYRRELGPQSLAARLSHRVHASLVYWRGRFGVPFGFLPHPTKLVIVVGTPLDVTKCDQPTQEQVDQLHQTFTTALQDLFQRHKHRMGPEWAKAHARLYLESESLPNKTKLD